MDRDAEKKQYIASVTCGLTTEDRDQLRNPTLVSCMGPYLTQQAVPVREAAPICPRPCKLTFDLLTLKVVWATSVPILIFPGLSVLDLGPM